MNSEQPSRYASDLAQLGVSAELFSEATDYAAEQARMCSEFDAPSMPGSIFWSRANRYLAEILTDREKHDPPWNWTKRDSILRVVHPSGSHAITAISAHGGVADLDAKVRSKNPKGRAMAHLVENNAKFEALTGQGVFYSSDDIAFGRELDEIPLWFLLYGKNKDGSLAAELSLPVKMDGQFVNEWSKRIPVFTNRPDPGINIDLLDKPEEKTTNVNVALKDPKKTAEDS
ncbi:hypothetical protein [Streptomyces sp. ME19-01-6]|uniref:hypothetical protein n=1 Tax=Streptomyces sp. ME19-01-6 TaxID=3028686 RepID=UPI0029B28739|nr:hypothetical protein [Streptomyces sp. ME19-01-6]MDX3232537.1 hypothetical protein [Streptomyces sp. ME19-01-6]